MAADAHPSAARAPARRLLPSGEKLLLAGLCLYILAVSVWPLARLFAEALRPDADGRVFGVFAEIWSSRGAWRALQNTLLAALGSTVVSVAVGGGAALLLRVVAVRGAAVLMFLFVLPMLIPPQISALAWLELLGPGSPVLALAGLAPAPGVTNPLYSLGGIVWVMGLEHAPLVLLSAAAGLKTIPRDLVEAARIAGARPRRVVRSVVLPLALPSVAAGAALAFVSAVGNFGVPALLGIPGRITVLTTFIYQRLNGFGPSVLGEIAAVAVVLAALAAAGLTVRWFLTRGYTAAIDRTAADMPPFDTGRWRWVVEGGLWLAALVISVLPLAALFSSALVPALGVPLGWETLTFANFHYLAQGSAAIRRAFANSLMLAGGAAAVCAVVSLPFAYFAVRRRSRPVRALNALADAPYAVPGTVLAVGVIMVLLPPLPLLGVSLYGTAGIILVAYLARFLPLGLRPVIASLQTVDPALDEAGRMVGARMPRRLASLVVPLLAPSALAGALLVFMTALNELTVSALLWSNGTETLGVMVFSLQYEGNSPAASALASVIVVTTLAIALALDQAFRRLAPGSSPWRS